MKILNCKSLNITKENIFLILSRKGELKAKYMYISCSTRSCKSDTQTRENKL